MERDFLLRCSDDTPDVQLLSSFALTLCRPHVSTVQLETPQWVVTFREGGGRTAATL